MGLDFGIRAQPMCKSEKGGKKESWGLGCWASVWRVGPIEKEQSE